MRRWSAGRHFVNGYGPTEGTVAATTAVLSPEDARPHIGRPLANVQLLVLNEDQQPVPVGTPGELYLSGLGLARGYLNQPELTTSRFVPLSLIESRSPAIYYRTGDLVRYLPDGNLEFLGRLDHQVKLRGFRIELGEIEAVLRQQTAVQDALVLARDERGTGPQLVAYMVGQGLDIAELRSTLGQRLPAYMVPTAFVLLDVFPLTPNGKIDRKALPPPTATAVAPYASPRNEVESNIANIWAEVLKQPRVGIHDNFFELGGHSLLGTQVISRIRHVMNIQIPLRLLFETPTVSGMSAMIETLMSGPGSSVTASSTDLSDEAEYEEGEI
jgi:acyl carrier protein